MSVSQPGSFQKVIKLQLEAFWGNHGRKVLALGGVLLVYALWYFTLTKFDQELHIIRLSPAQAKDPSWLPFGATSGLPERVEHSNRAIAVVGACRRTLFKVASTFLNLSETMADFGFLVSLTALLCIIDSNGILRWR